MRGCGEKFNKKTMRGKREPHPVCANAARSAVAKTLAQIHTVKDLETLLRVCETGSGEVARDTKATDHCEQGNTTRLATRFQIRPCVGVRSRNASTAGQKEANPNDAVGTADNRGLLVRVGSRARQGDSPCLACGSPNMDAFDRYVVCTVFPQAVNAASGCDWKGFSIDGLKSSSVLHTHLRSADSALVVVAVFR